MKKIEWVSRIAKLSSRTNVSRSADEIEANKHIIRENIIDDILTGGIVYSSSTGQWKPQTLALTISIQQ